MINKIDVYSCSFEDLHLKNNDVVLIAKTKNEYGRIPFFIHYYRMIGVKYFIFIDNNSSDGTYEFLLKQENTRVFFTTDALSDHHLWIKKVLDTFCIDHWSLIVDLDELFCFSNIENVKINQITEYLDLKGYDAMISILLDMYPRGFLSKAVVKGGYSPLSLLQFFDKNSHFIKYNKYYGGVRKRIFDVEPCLTKFPLIKYNPNIIIGPGMHSVKNVTPSKLSTALLHCKFDSNFKTKTEQAVKSPVYWNNSEEYKKYAEKYKYKEDFVFFEKDISVQYINSKTLISHNIINQEAEFNNYQKNNNNPELSLIICTYGENNIPQNLLKSIKEQTFKNFELIIVDNNEIPKINPTNDINYRIIHEKNRGLSFARNKGIESSLGEFMVFIDSDVVLDKKCLENLLNGANTYNSDLVGAQVTLRNDIESKLTKKERRFLSELIYEKDIEFINFPKYIVGACMMFRKSTFIKYGLFLTNLGRKGLNLLSGEDTEFIKRIIKYGGKVSYINNSICTHNINLKRIRFGYILKRAFWQGITDYKIDELFDDLANKKHKILESNIKNTLINISRFVGYKLSGFFN